MKNTICDSGEDSGIIESYKFLLTANLSDYEGKWIAVVDKEIVASDRSVKKAYATAKNKYPDKEPLLEKVFSKGTLIV